MIDCNQVLPELFVGSHPGSGDDIDRLTVRFRITAVLNLQMDEDMAYWGLNWPLLAAHYRQRGIEVKRVPIRDFDAVDLREKLPDAVRALHHLLVAGHTVYAHCTAGIGRAPAVIIAYLHWCRGWDLERAVAHVEARRACSPNVEAIQMARRDLLADAAVQRKIQRWAAEFIKHHPESAEDRARVWARAEREILQDILSSS